MLLLSKQPHLAAIAGNAQKHSSHRKSILEHGGKLVIVNDSTVARRKFGHSTFERSGHRFV